MNTTTDTAMPTLSTCPYEGCDAHASEYDSDGDLACPLHAAQSERYEIVTDLDEGTWCDRKVAARVEARLSAEGWSVAIRNPRRGESLATYRRNSNGLQILGYSIPTPDVLTSAVERAWSLAMQEPTEPAPIKTHIAITDGNGECQTYPVDTAEQRAEARAALRAGGYAYAPVYAGEPDGQGDSHRNGEVLYANERADDRVVVVADEEYSAEAFWTALPDALRDEAHELTAAQVAVVRGLLERGNALRGVECSRSDSAAVLAWAHARVTGFDDGPAHARYALCVSDVQS